ncbi:hypothetical protein MKX01_032401 [Papaver californicum]|nr:hypothetical protein MKX01_032401 [Papaver californicum]
MGLIQYCFLYLVVFLAVFNEPRGAYCTRFGAIISRGRGLLASAPATPGELCESMINKLNSVKTKDGYVLTLQRVNSANGDVKTKQPAFLQHGLFMDGASWFLDSVNQSLGFILADSGYDVWVANTRGTRYSRGHDTFDASYSVYWDWSWDELVQYDLPAFLGFVNQQTGKKINYIGHSLRTLMALASFTLGTNSTCQVLDKLRAVALLSPVAYLSHMGNQMSVYASKNLHGRGENRWIPTVSNTFLLSISTNKYSSIFTITTTTTCLKKIKKEKKKKLKQIELYSTNIKGTQSTSMRNCLHLAQILQRLDKGLLTKYDYVTANIQKYGQTHLRRMT